MRGNIHSIETFGSVDGPGVRFVIFLSGCPMRCKFCHNPDTWTMSDRVQKTADELLDQAERYRAYWGKEGGITVSGGEPLLQIDFLLELFQKAKERGIHTTIDTAGGPFVRKGPFFEKFQELMKYTDLLMVDIKHIDPLEHVRLTGLPIDHPREMFRYLDEIGKPIWIRHVLVPGITDVDKYLVRTREFISGLHNVEKIEVLPYHNMGAYKWEELGIPYALGNTAPPSIERVENATAILRGETNMVTEQAAEKHHRKIA